MPRLVIIPQCIFATAMLCVLPALGEAQATTPQPFVITDSSAVRVAESLFDAVDSLSAVVTPCVTAQRGTPTQCACRSSQQLQRVHRAARATEAQFPAWRGRVVNWTSPRTKLARAISLEAVLRQSSLTCEPR